MKNFKIFNFKKYHNKITILFFSIISFSLTTFLIGKENISFYEDNWLFSHIDLISQYVGWCFFSNDVWRFPIGLNPNYGTINNSIIFSDSIPLMAFLFKIIKPFLKFNFNYFGFWIFICFLFQGMISYKIILKNTNNEIYSFIAALFFLTAPIFLHKITHVISLGSHFFILASIYMLSFINNKKYYFWFIINLISLLVHFYLYIIVSIIFFIDLTNNILLKKKKLNKYFYYLFGYLILTIAIMYISGYFTINSINSLANGYGQFKFNLLGFFDPIQLIENDNKSPSGFSTWSLFLKDLPSFAEEYEGFSYLGLGIIFLLIFSLINYINNNELNFFKSLKNIYLLIFILFFVLSLSNNIDLGHKPILHIELNKYWLAILGIIRASGRLIWPAYYLIFLFVFIYCFKKNDPKKSISVLLLALIFQLVDISPGLKQIYKGKYFKENNTSLYLSDNQLKDPIWKILDSEKIIKTTFEHNYNSLLIKTGKYLCQNNIKNNIFVLARYDRFKVPENRYEIYNKIFTKKLDSNPYIVSENFNHILDISDRFKSSNLGFFYRDGIWIVQKNKKKLMNNLDIKFKNGLKYPLLTQNSLITAKNKNYFGIGWLADNSKVIMSDGNISSILFQINDLKQNKLIFEIEDKKINQDLIEFNIFINDKLIKTQKIFKKKTSTFQVDLNNIESKFIRIDFVFKEIKSQWMLKENINGKKSAIYLKSFRLE